MNKFTGRKNFVAGLALIVSISLLPMFLTMGIMVEVFQRQFLKCDSNYPSELDEIGFVFEKCVYKSPFPNRPSVDSRSTHYVRIRNRKTGELVMERWTHYESFGILPVFVGQGTVIWGTGPDSWAPWPPSWWTRFTAKLP